MELAEPSGRTEQLPLIICDVCQKSYSSVSALNKHKREQHNLTNHFGRPPSLRCADPSCSSVFTQMTDLCNHVHQEHHREDIILEEARFANYDLFEEWKRQVEIDTLSKFTKLCSSGKRSGKVPAHPNIYFQCHLSGYVGRCQRTPPTQSQRKRTSKKMDRHCTAFMKVKVDQHTGRVYVNGCLTHFGHDQDIGQLPLSDELKEEIVNLLRAGYADSEIVERIRCNATANDRAFYLKRYEVRNILVKLNKEGRMLDLNGTPDAMMSAVCSMEARRERLANATRELMNAIEYTSDSEWLERLEEEFLHLSERINIVQHMESPEYVEEAEEEQADAEFALPQCSRSGRLIKIKKRD